MQNKCTTILLCGAVAARLDVLSMAGALKELVFSKKQENYSVGNLHDLNYILLASWRHSYLLSSSTALSLFMANFQ